MAQLSEKEKVYLKFHDIVCQRLGYSVECIPDQVCGNILKWYGRKDLNDFTSEFVSIHVIRSGRENLFEAMALNAACFALERTAIGLLDGETLEAAMMKAEMVHPDWFQ